MGGARGERERERERGGKTTGKTSNSWGGVSTVNCPLVLVLVVDPVKMVGRLVKTVGEDGFVGRRVVEMDQIYRPNAPSLPALPAFLSLPFPFLFLSS